ncbi:MAG: hypothetical protein SF051_10355 [Elusimicrobiota bacterium]|nr:hypothetical protein [Elusimicrobiota bacterium]
MNALLLALAVAAAASADFAPRVSLTELRRAAMLMADPIPEPVLTPVQLGPVAAINRGFEALGPTGATGRVRGPDPFGGANGTYTMTENTAYRIVLSVTTGYISGHFVLRRDPSTGLDALGFTGRIKKDGQWGPLQQGESPGEVVYDARRDQGVLRWSINGTWREDSFRRSGNNNDSMRITLDGHAHEFTPN